ncbi:MAG: sigma 54-interacting transcriptional regulator [Polyangiaceae bacterium]|nr:sigma 54-interacting transcriptional regulator [Polyangiaceae bacterium]
MHRERFSFTLPGDGLVSIGRSAENDVRIDQRSVSRRHLQIHISSGRLEIEDLDSVNGTFFVSEHRGASGTEGVSPSRTDRRIVPHVRTPLACGEMVRVGSAFLLVHRPNPTTLSEALRATAPVGGTAIVVDPEVKRIYELGIRAAQTDITVLLLGETGVGKEVLAETIHAQSPRSQQPFLRLNCAALSETLLESELFGYERGAFTGAVTAKVGLLESTDGGTVFLDEIGELPLSTQAKLLRVIEDHAVRRVGSTRARRIDVRFITATNRDLRREVKQGRFREDLYFRINGVKLELPPLRMRASEIEPLARFFLHEFCARCKIPEPSLSPTAIERMLHYSWPGNVRELRNVMERAPFLVGEGYIQAEHIPREERPAPSSGLADEHEFEDDTELHATDAPTAHLDRAAVFPPPESLAVLHHSSDRNPERDRVQRALEACGGNQTRAARMLGISRRTLVNRLDEFNLPRPKKGP